MQQEIGIFPLIKFLLLSTIPSKQDLVEKGEKMVAKIEVPKFQTEVDFGPTLRKLRNNLGKTQKEMADFFGVSYNAYKSWELDNAIPGGTIAFWIGQNWHWIELLSE